MSFMSFMLALIGIPCSIYLAIDQNIFFLILTVMQIPHLITGIIDLIEMFNGM